MFGHHYFGKAYFGPRYWGPIVVAGANWDSSDPVFYDWWRKQAKRAKEPKPEQEIEPGDEVFIVPPISPPVVYRPLPSLLSALAMPPAMVAASQPAVSQVAAQPMIDEDEEEAALLLLMH